MKRIVLGLLLLAALSLLSLPEGRYTLLAKRIADLGHFPAYFLLTLLFTKQKRVPPVVIPAACAVLFEFIQPLFGRDFDWSDIVNSAGGAVTGAVFVTGQYRALILALSALWFGITLIPVVSELRTLRWQEENFPVLARFEDPSERSLWSFTHVSESPPAHNFVAGEGLLIPRKMYRGYTYRINGMDWSKCDELQLQLSGNMPSELSVRIDDVLSDSSYASRFNSTHAVSAGYSTLKISLSTLSRGDPLHPKLQLQHLRQLVLFTPKTASDDLLLAVKRMELIGCRD